MKYQYEFLQWPEYSQDQWIYLFGSVCTQSEKCWDSPGQKGQVPLSVTEILEREDKDYSTHWWFFSLLLTNLTLTFLIFSIILA